MTENEYKAVYDNDVETTRLLAEMGSLKDLEDKWFNARYGRAKRTIIERRHAKIINCWDGVDLKGLGLELAFGMGTSLRWLTTTYPEVTMDGVDFGEHLARIVPFLSEMPGVGQLWIGDARSVDKPDGHYDFINSCSVVEHLPEHVYWDVLRESFRLLKNGGLMGVYGDQGKPNEQHVRVVPPARTREECELVGFVARSDYLFERP